MYKMARRIKVSGRANRSRTQKRVSRSKRLTVPKD